MSSNRINNICTAQFRTFRPGGSPAEINVTRWLCGPQNSTRSPGIGFGANKAFGGWVMGRSGRDASTSLFVHRGQVVQNNVDWGSGVTFEPVESGVDVAFSSYDYHWQVYYVAR